MKIVKKILEIIFPSHCLSCEEIVNKEALFCNVCWPKLQFISEPKCKICSYPFEFQGFELICAKCLTKKPSYDKAISLFRYNDILKKIITSFKYHEQTLIAQKLSKLLISRAKDEIANTDIIIAVPLHVKRLRKRKFNQAILLARTLSKNHDLDRNIKFFPDFLIRTKNTIPQAELHKTEREKNLNGAFAFNEKYQDLIKGKNILLVDDIITTGATLEGCAFILKKHGAKKVIAITIAKTTLAN